MTGNLILNADPTTNLQAATKQYVDAVAQGIDVKPAAKVATTANIILNGLQTIDGIAVIAGNRVLVKNQTIQSQNGIYIVASGAWSRATDFDMGSEADGAFVFIESGGQASTGWVQTTPAPIIIGTTALVFQQFSGAGTYTADGQGIILSGSQFQLQLDGSTLSKSLSGIKVATGGITNNEVNAAAAIARSKIATNIANTVVIDDSGGNLSTVTLSAGQILQGNGSAVPTPTTVTGDILISSSGVTSLQANTVSNVNITAAAAIARSKITSGSANQVVINDGSGNLSSEAALAATRGGLATDASAFTGVVKAASGVFSASTIVNADISNIAAIARSKITSGSANQVVINDGSGNLSSVASISSSNGGTGLTTTPTNGQIAIGNGSGYTLSTLTGTTNQVNVTNAPGSVTLSTPQNIDSTASPSFAGLNLTDRIQLTEATAPATPTATHLDIFVESSNGFSRLRVLDSSGLKSTLLRDSMVLVKNVTGSLIAAGKAVYYTGADSGTNLPTIALAKGDSSLTVPAIGITIEAIANNGVGRVMNNGIVTNIDTSAFSQGSFLYLSAVTAGSLTATKPISPSNVWQRIGIVLVSNASTGSLEIRPFATHGEESGTNTGFTLNTFALTDTANIATDASKANRFTVTLAGNRNLSAPTNPTDGQKCTWEFKQDVTGNRTLTFDVIFNFGVFPTLVLTGTAAKVDYMGAIYNSASSTWNVVAYSTGF